MRSLVVILVLLLMAGRALHAADISVARLEAGGATAIFIEGRLVLADVEQFRRQADARATLVVLNSDGGSMLAAIEIGEMIRQRNLATFVPGGSRCASACAIAWLGGARRFMEADSRIGFHAAYQMRAGQAVETGVGNALLGAYLHKMGLPASAIVYITQAAPNAMTWLSLREAGPIGIEVTPLRSPARASAAAASSAITSAATTPGTGTSSTTTSPASASSAATSPAVAVPVRTPAQAAELEIRALHFMDVLFQILSRPPHRNASLLDMVYAEEVNYNGVLKPRSIVLEDKLRLARNGPQRKYSIRSKTLNVRCDSATALCLVVGITDWHAGDRGRDAAIGAENFSYSLLWKSDAFEIIAENSALLDR